MKHEIPEKYNYIREEIEKLVNDRPSDFLSDTPIDYKAEEERIFSEVGLYLSGSDTRNKIATLFLGTTFERYTKRRLMMRAYSILLLQDSYNSEPLLNITGYSNSDSFRTAFKECFQYTPTEAFEKKDRTLYEYPEYWGDLTTTQQETIIVEVEVEIEVEVEKEKPIFYKVVDRRPYKIVVGIILLLTVIVMVICSNLSKRGWSGDYIGYTIDTNDTDISIEMLHDVKFSISAYKNKLTIYYADGTSETTKLKLRKNNISWKDCAGAKFSGSMLTDFSIICDVNGSDDSRLRLIRETAFNQWAEQWDGYYEIYNYNDNYLSGTDKNINIWSDELFFIYSSFTEENVKIGRMYYIGPDRLIVYFPDSKEMWQCDLSGDLMFEIKSRDTDELIGQCLKVTKAE